MPKELSALPLSSRFCGWIWIGSTKTCSRQSLDFNLNGTAAVLRLNLAVTLFSWYMGFTSNQKIILRTHLYNHLYYNRPAYVFRGNLCAKPNWKSKHRFCNFEVSVYVVVLPLRFHSPSIFSIRLHGGIKRAYSIAPLVTFTEEVLNGKLHFL